MKRILSFLLILLTAVLCCSCGPIEENKIILNGKEYSLPISVSELMENGWEYTDKESPTLKPNSRTTLLGYGHFSYQNGKGSILACNVLNMSDKYASMEDCFIESLIIKKGDVELPMGLTLNSTPDDIVKAFGEPDNDNSNFTGCERKEDRWNYNTQKESKISYSFIFNENDPSKLASIKVSYDKTK